MKLYSIVVVVPKMGTAKSRCDFDFSRSQNDPDYFIVLKWWRTFCPPPLYGSRVVVLKMRTATMEILLFFFLRHLLMGFLLDKQPRRKAVFEVAFVFLTLSDCHLLPQFFNQCIVLFAQTLR